MVDTASRAHQKPDGGQPVSPGGRGPLRVLHGLLQFPVLSETFIVREMLGLLREGHDLRIAALRRGDQEATATGGPVRDLLERTTFLELPERPSTRIVRLPAALATCWRRHGAAVALRSLTRGRDARTLRPLFEVAGLPAGASFEIVHCHFGPAGLHGLRWKRAGIARRLVVTFHANDLVRPVAEHGAAYYSPLFAGADLLLAVSGHGRRRLLELGAPEDRVRVQPCPVDWGDRPAVELHREPGVLRVVSVGRLVEKKGHRDAMDCLALVAHRHPAVGLHHTIVGTGPLLGELQRHASRLPANLRVTFTGACPPGQVERVLRGSDLFLLPSRTAPDGDEEGLPVALMEAMVLGLPVVSTRHAGIPELVEHGKTGLLAPEGDVETLAGLVERLLREPGLGRRLGSAGRTRVLARHDLSMTTASLVDHYRSLEPSP